MRRRHTNRGLTLVELMVGITITGMALSAGYAAVGTALDHRARLLATADTAASAAAKRRQLAEWLAGAMIVSANPDGQFRGQDGVRDGATDDALTLVTAAPTPATDKGLTRMRLFVDRDTTTLAFGLVAAFRRFETDEDEIVLPIEPRVTGLDARYLSAVIGGQKWWPSWISGTALPAGLEIALSASAGDTLPPLLRLPILVALDGGR